MTRVAFDTNIRISAVVFQGTPLQAILTAEAPGFLQVTSEILLEEFRDVFLRKFSSRNIGINFIIEKFAYTP